MNKMSVFYMTTTVGCYHIIKSR